MIKIKKRKFLLLPGDGIGPEMMGYVKDIFREVGAPVDFETVELDPTTDNYDDLHNVITCQLIYFILLLSRYMGHI